jgi:hypothetical protein
MYRPVDAAERFGPFRPDIDATDRAAQLGELRGLVAAFCWHDHKLSRALRAAETGDEAALAEALAEIDALPSLRKRRILSVFGLLRRPNV